MKVGDKIRFTEDYLTTDDDVLYWLDEDNGLYAFFEKTHRIVRKGRCLLIRCPGFIGGGNFFWGFDESDCVLIESAIDGPCVCDWPHCRRRVVNGSR